MSSGNPAPVPSTAASNRDIEWSFVLCDLTGTAITILDNVATGRQIIYTLNRPAQATFTVPSDSPRANLVHTDGDPYLNEMTRVLKCYRLEVGGWVLRFAGIVFQIQDQADESGCYSQVTCFDPSQVLYSRLVMDGVGTVKTVVSADFSASNGDVIAKELVDHNVSNVGTAYLTTGGTFDTTTALTVVFNEGETVGQALETLTQTDTLDVVFDPLDGSAGLFAQMSVVAKRGNNSTTAVFAYDTLNYSVKSFGRLKDGTLLANDVRVAGSRPAVGASWVTEREQDTVTSQPKYGVYQSWRAADPNISDTTFLDDLAVEELAFRKNPREQLSLVPFPERGPVPFTEYFLGDTIYFYCSENARQAISGAQRVYGLTVDISDNAFETISEVRVEAA